MQRAEGMWYVAARACAQSSTTCFEYVATLPAGLVVVYQMEGEVGRRKMQVCRFTVPGTRRGGVWVVESLGLIRVQGQEFKLELRHERGIELRSGGPVTGLLGTTRLETELIGLVKMKLGGYQEVGIFSVEESVIWESGEEYAAVALSLILTGGVFNQSHHYFDRKRR
ncbi:hypothetical protein BC830DRAFT_89022 [Chytriomyces sp. MP71]|nr:hypothetical protein BC830DRAFT_89022 [Chytriomyces sp. MP71]